MTNHENQPGTMKKQPGTMKTMKTHLEPWKTKKKPTWSCTGWLQVISGDSKEEVIIFHYRTFLLYYDHDVHGDHDDQLNHDDLVTMMTRRPWWSVRKLEVVHKQVEGYLIPYNRQLAFVRKLKVILPDACIVTSIALNLKIKNWYCCFALLCLDYFWQFWRKIVVVVHRIGYIDRYHNCEKISQFLINFVSITQS